MGNENEIRAKRLQERKLARVHLTKLYRRFARNPSASSFLELERFMFIWQQMVKNYFDLSTAQVSADGYIEGKYPSKIYGGEK